MMLKNHNSITLEEIRQKAVPIFKKAQIIHSAVFGSAARGDMKSDSDVDFIIEFQEKKTLLDLVGLQLELEKVLGRKVDLVTRRSIFMGLKEYIEREAISIM